MNYHFENQNSILGSSTIVCISIATGFGYLDAWVLDTSCSAFEDFSLSGYGPKPIHGNIGYGPKFSTNCFYGLRGFHKASPFYSLCWSTPAFSFGSGSTRQIYTVKKKKNTIGDLNREMLG